MNWFRIFAWVLVASSIPSAWASETRRECSQKFEGRKVSGTERVVKSLPVLSTGIARTARLEEFLALTDHQKVELAFRIGRYVNSGRPQDEPEFVDYVLALTDYAEQGILKQLQPFWNIPGVSISRDNPIDLAYRLNLPDETILQPDFMLTTQDDVAIRLSRLNELRNELNEYLDAGKITVDYLASLGHRLGYLLDPTYQALDHFFKNVHRAWLYDTSRGETWLHSITDARVEVPMFDGILSVETLTPTYISPIWINALVDLPQLVDGTVGTPWAVSYHDRGHLKTVDYTVANLTEPERVYLDRLLAAIFHSLNQLDAEEAERVYYVLNEILHEQTYRLLFLLTRQHIGLNSIETYHLIYKYYSESPTTLPHYVPARFASNPEVFIKLAIPTFLRVLRQAKLGLRHP